MLDIVFVLSIIICISSADDYILGTNATLLCEHDTPKYGNWQKSSLNERSMYSDLQTTTGKYGSIRSKNLTIYNLTTKDNGYYRCSFNNTVDGNWGRWNTWQICTKTCGGGTQTRNRDCNNPSPFRGSPCIGDASENKNCLTVVCPVNGNWGGWNGWTRCSKTCGGGRKYRSRVCNNPSPNAGGLDCNGVSRENSSCSSYVCPVNGNWGRWNGWTKCSKTCGGGRKYRSRLCNNPSPISGGSYCNGVSRENSSCSSNVCPVNGNWGRWNRWTRCSKTCGGGKKYRSRLCNNPSPIAGGLYCNGVSRENSSCSSNVCPVNGNWGRWNGWTRCSKTCGGGRKYRSRLCNNPSPIAGGLDCNGVSRENSSCSSNLCPVNGNWGRWNGWTRCSKTCGGGRRTRHRICNNPSPIAGGLDCNGVSRENSSCSSNVCPGRLYDSLTIGCDLEQNRRNIIDWSTARNFLRDTRNKYKGTHSYLLKILNLQYTDNGKYRCSFWNGQTQNYGIFINLNVYGAPKVTILRQSHFVQIGTTVTFVCNIESNPAMSELWWTDNQAKHITDKLRYNGGNIHNHNLSIISVKDSDSGVYTCNANNTEGTSKATTTLITGNITQTTILKDLYVAIDEQDITLECLIKTDPSNKKLYWLKNGKDLRPYLRSKYSGGTLSEQSLTLKNVDNNDAGNYTCKLENQFGTSEDVAELKVLSAHVEDPVNMKILANGTVTLKCVITGGNSVVWRRNYQIIDTNSNVRYSGSTVNTPSLTITKYLNKTRGTGDLKPIVGGGVGALAAIAILIAIICVVFRRRRESHLKRQIVTTNYKTGAEAVQFRLDIDEDEVSPSILTNPSPPKDDHISIKVPDLKEYIFKKQQNNKLEDEYKNIKYGVLHPTTTSQQKANLLKNRFKEIFAYDHTRVVLEPGHGKSSDYINASYVDGFKKEKCYIASQGPLTKTINDHWRMIWQNNTRKIIMLTNLVEGTKRKCERYWPEGGKPMTCGNLVLTLQAEKERAAYTTREIELEDKTTEEKRCIIQYHFTAWPDHGTPDPLYLVLFHKHVRSDHTSTENNGPLLVHCSAGIGRTGTYIGLDALYEEGRDTGFVDVAKFVEKMRFSRMNMVQTAEQYVCLHYALLEAFTMKDTNVGKKEFGNIWREISEDKGPVNRRRLHEEFEMLKAKTSEQDKAEYAAAKSQENLGKNRNESIVPSDKNRLFLVSYKKGRTDYINAVQAPSYTKFVGYLTTQLPLPDTMVDFWTMVGDHSSSTIVVFLNNPAEAELVYSTSKDSFVYGKYTLKTKRGEQEDLGVTSCTVFLSKKGDQSREIAMYLAVTEDLPGPQVMCKLVNRISSRVSRSNDPVTVVSGDGAKNCGIFCAFFNAVSSMTIDKTADVFQLARLLQLRRPEFFADFEEYCLCYEALNHYLVSSKVYENI
ncbi:Tyrosine-protein phosphatase 1,Hemicentin-1,Coadhesin,Tyrosine-protein phosphatase non-receptor type 13,Tyrosine-protein phosphatase non-receptor type 5,Thrombospondin-2,Tyrosine-protein phosphatase non-receptor type 11,Thrombospondin-1,Mucin-like protein,Tyrosine-protein phosphatase corkscrew [Mytilus edulis]|uniref:protein-tyrosine-phosphatase n=1 Tax=Mytilus edulis TaxID=6550 RepID=A0A8S3ST79_MYTED|nr:Tyrosine-protein phosphatase 1,Hemicentin-1,Coadhesin,Tyrosine-protein phosphatase non-receptor type 13,Tyrosine-protein phosphatase non-receptor type 5,Thrombospondin-2,Tyrosine-protein phosphatase non-receptor type 11,Thrombospondin-1,Mucin-like protein,Tyrosine-protein phosphatase corkscrew [Mytilus edulis]